MMRQSSCRAALIWPEHIAILVLPQALARNEQSRLY